MLAGGHVRPLRTPVSACRLRSVVFSVVCSQNDHRVGGGAAALVYICAARLGIPLFALIVRLVHGGQRMVRGVFVLQRYFREAFVRAAPHHHPAGLGDVPWHCAIQPERLTRTAPRGWTLIGVRPHLSANHSVRFPSICILSPQPVRVHADAVQPFHFHWAVPRACLPRQIRIPALMEFDVFFGGGGSVVLLVGSFVCVVTLYPRILPIFPQKIINRRMAAIPRVAAFARLCLHHSVCLHAHVGGCLVC
mmetsp:Transcript_22835/g.38172  ORF Transcript_22835/g.38172 Transcript_22835/m.38172 type:complete len:249 (+) Transcript_22835:251-997(+)